jgi:hypothetical protein
VTVCRPRIRTAAAVAVLAAVAGATSGCAWQPYVVTRGIRHLAGNHTRVHPIVPLTISLKPYRVVEVMPLQSLLGGAIPTATERYIDERVMNGLRVLPSSPQVIVLSDAAPAASDASGAATHTLRVEGFIDDLDAGSLPLRIAELGFNHVAVTVRIRLRDKATSQVLGAASFTAQDDRVTASANGAINNVAKRISDYVGSGYER